MLIMIIIITTTFVSQCHFASHVGGADVWWMVSKLLENWISCDLYNTFRNIDNISLPTLTSVYIICWLNSNIIQFNLITRQHFSNFTNMLDCIVAVLLLIREYFTVIVTLTVSTIERWALPLTFRRTDYINDLTTPCNDFVIRCWMMKRYSSVSTFSCIDHFRRGSWLYFLNLRRVFKTENTAHFLLHHWPSDVGQCVWEEWGQGPGFDRCGGVTSSHTPTTCDLATHLRNLLPRLVTPEHTWTVCLVLPTQRLPFVTTHSIIRISHTLLLVLLTFASLFNMK